MLVVATTIALVAVATPASAHEPGPTTGPCQYTPTPDEPAARPVPVDGTPALRTEIRKVHVKH